MSSSAVRAPAPSRPALVRDRDCAVAGVSAGLARHLSAPLWMVRALFIALTLCGGAGVLLYAWCWVFMPWAEGDGRPSRRMPVAWMLCAAAAVGTVAVLSLWIS